MPRNPDRLPGRRWYASATPDRFAEAGYPHTVGSNPPILPRRRILDAAAAGLPLAEIPAVARVPAEYLAECMADVRFRNKIEGALERAANRGYANQPYDEQLERMQRLNRRRRGQRPPPEPRDGAATISAAAPPLPGGGMSDLDMQITMGA